MRLRGESREEGGGEGIRDERLGLQEMSGPQPAMSSIRAAVTWIGDVAIFFAGGQAYGKDILVFAGGRFYFLAVHI